MKECYLNIGVNGELVLLRERDDTIIARNIIAGENVQKDWKGKLVNVNWEKAEKQANNYGYTLY